MTFAETILMILKKMILLQNEGMYNSFHCIITCLTLFDMIHAIIAKLNVLVVVEYIAMRSTLEHPNKEVSS